MSNIASTIAHKTAHICKRYGPEMLTALGITGFFTTAVLVGKAVLKAKKTVDEITSENPEESEPLQPKEVIKATWKYFVPALLIAISSTACIVGASSINFQRNAAIATAYMLSESSLKEYQNAVKNEIGEDKEKEIRKKVAVSKFDNTPVRDVILTDSGGEIDCYEPLSDRYFKSDREIIQRAINVLNRRMLDEMSISVNDLYDELRLPNTKAGELIGWNIDKGYISVDFSATVTRNGKPCLVINYETPPNYYFN